MIRIAEVRPGSIGESLGITAGEALLRINGESLADAVDLLFHQADERIELETESPDGTRTVYEIEKDVDDSLGLVPEPDKIRRCTNACPFCFVKGNPGARKLRASLYIKDDDYRLSFLYGHYVTLTNLREEDWERILTQRLSPLYVSVHAMDPGVRLQMLKNPRSARIGEDLSRLADGGISIHAQVVLCPGLNDGAVLDGTIEDLYERGERILSLSIVPVGLTDHNADRGIRTLTAEECRHTVERVAEVRRRALEERGVGWCYAADELFIQAGLELPGSEHFDDQQLVSNGVGAISLLRERVSRDLGSLPRLDGHRVVLVTGTSMGPSLHEMADQLSSACGAEVVTAVRHNTLYGPMVTTTGLLSGQDHLEALRPYERFDLALVSRTALNDDELFLDDMSLAELRSALPDLEIFPSDNITDVLLSR